LITDLAMPSSHRFAAARLAAISLSCASALLTLPAEAADKPGPAPSAKTNPDAVLTPAQLRDCLTQKERLRSDSEAAVKAKAGIDALQAEIAGSGSALAEEATTLERSNAEAVAAYNAKIGARNALVDSFKAKAALYNQDVEGLQAAQEAYAKSCEKRRYDDRDLSDLQKKKK
jgi:hypothetical protein